ncbi:MAG TPA: hypothetical protein VLF91_02210 [Candidatus Saccharimonadales bacterium]|nr:hypothetical protein [Candidatus Saccharimonadales bacterium]
MSRAGNKAFSKCEVKIVEFDTYIRPYDDPKKIVASGNGSGPGNLVGYKAHLRCPKTEDPRAAISSDTMNAPTKLRALANLGALAGELMCKGCRFSAMTPLQVTEERARMAHADAELADAQAHLERARHELSQTLAIELPAAPEAAS